MLKITIPESEVRKAFVLSFEHSLLSVSKWEARFGKPFFGKDDKTLEETAAYIEEMLLDENPPEGWFDSLSKKDFVSITEYINSPQSATWFRESPGGKKSSEVITSELVYFWMTQFKIPFHPTETWHFNRLMTLIRIAGSKQTKPKKMSKAELQKQYHELNERRRRELGTSG